MRSSVSLRSREKVAVMGVLTDSASAASVDEMGQLVEAAGGLPVLLVTQRLDAPHPQTYLGTGKARELAGAAKRAGAELIVADDDLSPAQVRNVERETGIPVIDRSELILAIFALRARSAEARDQVELAQLEYLLPRLRGMWKHLERHGGGIGTRGPGEKQLESDRRLANRRVEILRQRIRRIAERRDREVATRTGEFTASLVGYTNAGKSTLMNRLTGAGVVADDRLFATLQTYTRKLPLPAGGSILLSDTVGFIRKLPHHLVSSFRATLSEAASADLLLHVVDASDPEMESQYEACREVLVSLGCGDRPTLVVANKIDRLAGREALLWLRSRATRCVEVSATSGQGIDALLSEVEQTVEAGRRTLSLSFSAAEGALYAALRRRGRILEERIPDGMSYRVRVRIAPSDWGYIRGLASGKIRARWLKT